MKNNLRWKYNNIRIKEKDEWKAAFTIPEGLFEPTVMFFRLTNSLAMYYKLKNLQLFKRKNLIFRLTQENSIENSI